MYTHDRSDHIVINIIILHTDKQVNRPHQISRIIINLQVIPTTKIDLFLQLHVSPKHHENEKEPNLDITTEDSTKAFHLMY